MAIAIDYEIDGEVLCIRAPREDEFFAIYDLRYRILYEPFGIAFEEAIGQKDLLSTTVNVAAFWGTLPISTVRLEPYGVDGTYLVRRMATDKSWQRKGVGAQLMKLAEYIATERGARRFILHSRPEAENFYSTLGYIKTGNLFEVEGFIDLEMIKEVSNE